MLANLFLSLFFRNTEKHINFIRFSQFFPPIFHIFCSFNFYSNSSVFTRNRFFLLIFSRFIQFPKFSLNFFTFSFSWKRYFLVRNPMTRIPNWSLNWSSNWSWKSLTTNRKLVRNWISDRCDQQQLLIPVALFSALGT